MERRGFFARMLGAVAALFGVPVIAVALDERQPHSSAHFKTVDICAGGAASCGLAALEHRDESHVESLLVGIEVGVAQQQLAHNAERFSIHVAKHCTPHVSRLCESYGRKPESVRSLGSARDEIVVPAAKYRKDELDGYQDGFASIYRRM